MAAEQDAPEISDEMPQRWRTIPLMLAILLALALGLIVFFAGRATEQREQAIAEQRHSFEVMMLATKLEGTIANAEVLLARYVVSLDRRFGLQFQAEWRRAQAEVTALERATRRDTTQQANVAELKTIIAERRATLNDIALRTRYDQKVGALAHFYQAGNAPTIPRMREVLKRTIQHEQQELSELNQRVNRSETIVSRVNNSYTVVGLALLAAAILALWFAYGSAQERRFTVELADAEAQRGDQLAHAVEQRTAELRTANDQLRLEMQERARAEQSVRHLQKMEALGKLTGGIAHDFNNMLAVVVSGIDLAKRALRRDPEAARRHLGNAMEGAHRAASLTSRLLAFARPDSPGARHVDIDMLILDMHALIDRASDDGIALLFDLDGQGWGIRVEPTQLENAVLNLAINSRDAMEGRGTLTISTRCETLSQGEIDSCKAGDHVRISVTDTGSGMTQDVINRAFEPFFTTKPIGKGTGLGLSQIFGFVRAAGGVIDVQSVPGEGTTISLLIPRDERQDDGAAQPISLVEDSELDDEIGVRDGQLVLVVEDDPRVLRSTMAALAALGHQGISCNHPGKAANLLARNPETALIISDVLMPDMTGPEMIAQLGDALIGKPILFVTGYAGEGERGIQLSGLPVLRKPFTVAQLGRAIDDALEKSLGPERTPPSGASAETAPSTVTAH
jgi:signal transduction histidine kinase/FixJ family two-component response regulator